MKSGVSNNLEGEIRSIVAEILEIDESKITPDARFVEDLGADSLDTVELVMALEEEFGIEIPDEDAEKAKTVQDVIDYISKKLIQEGKAFGSIK